MPTCTKNDALNTSFGENSPVNQAKLQFDSTVVDDSPDQGNFKNRAHFIPAQENNKLLLLNQEKSDYSPGPFVPDEKPGKNFNQVIPSQVLPGKDKSSLNYLLHKNS